MAADPEIGAVNITRADLCERAGVPEGSFNRIVGGTFVNFIRALGPDDPMHEGRLITRRRVAPEARQGSILDAALRASEAVGYMSVTRLGVAEAAGISPALVTRYFANMRYLRTQIMLEAVRKGNVAVVLQGLAAGDKIAQGAPPHLRSEAAKSITN